MVVRSGLRGLLDRGGFRLVLLFLAIVGGDGLARGLAASLPATIWAPAGVLVRIDQGGFGRVSLTDAQGTRQVAIGSRIRLTVRGGGELHVGALAVDDLEAEAARIVVEGRISSRTVSLHARDLIDVEPAGVIAAARTRLESRVVLNTGRVDADGPHGGEVDLVAENVLNQGALQARGRSGDGGTVRVTYSRYFVESARGSIDVSATRRGGAVRVVGQKASHLFTSGSYAAIGEIGGRVALSARGVDLVGASISASGRIAGGSIDIGDVGPDRFTHDIRVAPSASLRADGQDHGSGGRIVLASLDRTALGGRVSARGGARGGNGGFVEISSQGRVDWTGTVETEAPRGRAGRLLIDPKTITISDKTKDPLPSSLLLQNPTPGAGDTFGSYANTTVLPNGNVVVNVPDDDLAGTDTGASYLFSGTSGALISTLVGTHAGDKVPYATKVLANGNYVLASIFWHDITFAAVGAVTWADGQKGVAGTVSPANSLVGTSPNDLVGVNGVVALTNGNYVVSSPRWDHDGVADVGAITWADGSIGGTGEISEANSLIGSSAGDQIGSHLVVPLANGNYVVASPLWDNGTIVDAGAVTWANGRGGTVGKVSPQNSLVGSTASDKVPGVYYTVSATGDQGYVVGLPSGDYVVNSTFWHNPSGRAVGALTHGNGRGGTVGAISAANSLVGGDAGNIGDFVGIYPLANGNYVIGTPYASDDTTNRPGAGAATWCNGMTGCRGMLSSATSLIGATTNDGVAWSVTPLANGNYVVMSYAFDNGTAVDAGAATWGDGSKGVAGVVSAANSLVGTTTDDQLGWDIRQRGAVALTNGNYVVPTRRWHDGSGAAVGAVTWADGSKGITGEVSASNSLIGAQLATALTNGNYVAGAPTWNNGSIAQAGAAVWADGTTGVRGAISKTSSLVGTQTNQMVGTELTALKNGNYVVTGLGNLTSDGKRLLSVTWGDGTKGITGDVGTDNSVFNIPALPYGHITALPNGNYVVNGGSWMDGTTPTPGSRGSAGGNTVAALPDGNYVSVAAMTTSTIPSSTYLTVSICDGRRGAFCMGPEIVRDLTIPSLAFTQGVPGTLVVPTNNAAVRILVLNLDSIHPRYAWQPDASVVIWPEQIVDTLARGLDVTLEASNDIIVERDVVVRRAGAKAGALTLSAGRSVLLGAKITTDGGDLSITANDRLANGVVDAQRAPGPGGITWGSSVAVDAGGGAVKLAVRDGAGKTNREGGPLQLGQLAARSVLAQASGVNVQLVGAVTASGPGDAIVLVSDTGLDLRLATMTTLSAPAGRFLLYAPSPATAMTGALPLSFQEFGKAYPSAPDPANTGSGILFASGGAPRPPTVTIEQASGQADPATGDAVVFDVAFDQAVSGFDAADVDLSLSTVGGTLAVALSGGPQRFSARVTGMTSAGIVVARVRAGACQGTVGGMPSAASTSVDNMVSWSPAQPADGGRADGQAPPDTGGSPDAGGPPDAGGSSDAGGPPDAASDAPARPPNDGCSCATSRRETTPLAGLAAAVGVLIALRRSRKARRHRSRRYDVVGVGTLVCLSLVTRSALALTIDPGVAFSRFLGGTGSDSGISIAVDGAGSLYVAGMTSSQDLGVSATRLGVRGTADPNFDPLPDIFVVKLTPSGELLRATLLGGSLVDTVAAMAVDAAGNVYLVGTTKSTDFPLVAAYQPTHGANYEDTFVAKLDATGTKLVYSTFLGGLGRDTGAAIAVDLTGNAYVTGTTDSPDFPTKSAFSVSNAGLRIDAFVTKLGPAGELVYSTFLGGTWQEAGWAIAVDDGGFAYAVGATSSLDFPLKSALQTTLNRSATNTTSFDAFVTKLSASGDSVVFSTYLGGGLDDTGRRVAVDASGAIYVAGSTRSRDFPTVSAVQAQYSGPAEDDCFIAKLSPSGASIAYATYLGGTASDYPAVLTVDSSGNAFVGGYTASADFPVSRYAFQRGLRGTQDGFVAELSASGSSLVFSSFLGGSRQDVVGGVATGGAGITYVTGTTGSGEPGTSDFLTGPPFDEQKRGGYGAADAIVVKFIEGLSPADAGADGGPAKDGGDGRDGGAEDGPAADAGDAIGDRAPSTDARDVSPGSEDAASDVPASTDAMADINTEHEPAADAAADAATPVADAAADAASSKDAPADARPSGGGGGCGCTVADQSRPGAPLGCAIAVLVIILRRRRARCTRR